MSAAITLTAHYFLETEDTDGDGVRDWFEWRNFGTLYQGQQDDADGDGFTNGQEDALGQEPTIFDEVEDGGVPARRSPPFTYADTSMVKYTIKSDPLGFVDTTERYVEINGSTTSANLHGESNGYTFAYWSVNGVRQAAGAGVAVSQVTTRVEDTTVAIAHYLPTTEDSDGDGVADWFELNQFGDLNSGPQDDADGDSFTNAQEEALGQEATIRDEVEDGGVTARRSKVITYADTSMVAYTMKSTPAGFVEESTGYVEQNATVTTPNLHGESNGYTFAYWSLNGVRQTSPNGLSISQVTASISATSTLVARYLPTTEDSDGDGVEDWFEMYQFGDLSQSPDDDMDGDGFSNRQENELGQEALIIDEVEDGGVTARRSKSVLYFEQQNYAPSGLELNNTITFTNLPTDTLVGGLTPTDLNDAQLEDTYTYSLLAGPGGEDYARYSLSANLLRTANLFSAEANHSLLIRVTDPEGLHFDKNFTIHVLDPTGDPDGDGLSNQQEWLAGTRYDHPDSDGDGFSDGAEISAGTNPLDADSFPNSAPTDLNSTDVLIVAENQPAGTFVGEFNATDPDSGAILTYTLVSGQGDTHNDFFSLDENGTLTTASVLDYEAGQSLSIRVRVQDEYNAQTEGNFTVLVTNDPADDVAGTFTVSGGQHEFPYFQFTDADGQTPDFSTLRLQKGAIYEFVSSNIASGHTFMIGESYGDTSSELVTGNTLNSYQNGQKLTLAIPADFSGELYYFCTYHSHMVQPFLVGRKTHNIELNSSVSLEMIWVEPGTFTMGSPETEAGRKNDAGRETQHEVTLIQGFYLGKYEVTQAQYEAVMTGNDDGLNATPSNWPNNPGRPVEMVSWEDIQKFLIRLNTQQAGNIPEGWAYVLPTEAQWEYACRAGTTTAYSWGDNISATDANWNHGNDASQTEDVGQYSANPWGFFDMHGNVWEWTADAYASIATGAQTDPFNVGTTGSSRVARGGSWGTTGLDLRSAYRNLNNEGPSYRSIRLGFRLALKNTNQAPVDLNSTT
ncbi:SUMF1/EgtB/PvdO family nonheme iron enzyme, partial [Opitutales bacterium]|nr:SUMF1/EgtB/PvdO family nonheme iron enzyme [Opitutales bacterium]